MARAVDGADLAGARKSSETREAGALSGVGVAGALGRAHGVFVLSTEVPHGRAGVGRILVLGHPGHSLGAIPCCAVRAAPPGEAGAGVLRPAGAVSAALVAAAGRGDREDGAEDDDL